MENQVTVKNTTKEAFTKAFELIEIDNQYYSLDKTEKKEQRFRCSGYKVEEGRLILTYRRKDKNFTDFPYDLNLTQAVEFAWGWLENNRLDPMTAPDTDGSTAQAFEVTTEKMGWSGRYGEMLSVQPIWFIYGK